MATLSAASVKGVRARYRNTLDKEIKHANCLLEIETSELQKSDCLKEVRKCKQLLKTYSEKLMIQMVKGANCLGDKDPEFVEQIIDQDCQLRVVCEYAFKEFSVRTR